MVNIVFAILYIHMHACSSVWISAVLHVRALNLLGQLPQYPCIYTWLGCKNMIKLITAQGFPLKLFFVDIHVLLCYVSALVIETPFVYLISPRWHTGLQWFVL